MDSGDTEAFLGFCVLFCETEGLIGFSLRGLGFDALNGLAFGVKVEAAEEVLGLFVVKLGVLEAFEFERKIPRQPLWALVFH